MKYFVIVFLSLATFCVAEPPSSYGAPPPSNYGPPSPGPTYGVPQGGPWSSHQQGRIEITKDVYVHIPPPEEPSEFEGGFGRPQVQKKNYKIIFIKAPSVDFEQQFKFRAQNQQEEKTIVYVLSKKPELDTLLNLQNENKKKSPKPEVYFIKYKAEKEKTTGPYPPSTGPYPPSISDGPYH